MRLVRERGEQGLDPDRGRDVMDEIDQHRDARESEQHAEGDGEMRHEAGALDASDRAQDEQAIDEGRR